MNQGKLRKLHEVYTLLKTFRYGFPSNKYPKSISDEVFWDVYVNQTVKEFMANKIGICWDFARAEEYLLSKYYGRENTHLYMVLSGGRNHTFCIVKIDNTYYYIECAFEKYKGLYMSDNLTYLTDFVVDNFMTTLPDRNPKIGLLEYEDHNQLSNLTGREFYDYVTTNGIWSKVSNRLRGKHAIMSLENEEDAISQDFTDDDWYKEYSMSVDELSWRNSLFDTSTEDLDAGIDYLFREADGDDEEVVALEAKLKAKQRNALPSKVFGIPSLRKYPLHDKAHVLSAIRMFNHVDKEHEKELAGHIKGAMKKFGISKDVVGEKNRLYDYL